MTPADERPVEQMRNCVVLSNPLTGATVYVVGTAHAGDSKDDVASVIRNSKPQTIVVELCESRSHMLQKSELEEIAESIAGADQGLDLLDTAKSAKSVILDWSNLIPMMYQVMESLMGEIGGEFSTAFDEANKLPGTTLVLGDRDVVVTKARMQALVPIKELLWDSKWLGCEHEARQSVRLCRSLQEEQQQLLQVRHELGLDQDNAERRQGILSPATLDLLDRVTNQDQAWDRVSMASEAYVEGVVYSLLLKLWRYEPITVGDKQQLSDALGTLTLCGVDKGLPPTLEKVLLEERDPFLAHALLEASSAPGVDTVVGVVGAAHLPGIQRLWSAEPKILRAKIEEYSAVPETSPITAPRVAGAATLVGLPLACYKSQCFRRVLGVTLFGTAAVAAWGFYELNDRIKFYKRQGAGASGSS